MRVQVPISEDRVRQMQNLARFVYRVINQANIAHHADDTWGDHTAQTCRDALNDIGSTLESMHSVLAENTRLQEEVEGLRRVKEAFTEQTANLHALQYAAENGKGGAS